MDYLALLKTLALCIGANFCYSMIFSTPKRAMLISSVVGAVGYAIYLAVSYWESDTRGYLVGTLFIAALGEIFARRMKMPATIFIIPAIIPLVPGYGLYRTMLFVTLGDLDRALLTGVDAFMAAGAMAIAIAMTNLIARTFFTPKLKK